MIDHPPRAGEEHNLALEHRLDLQLLPSFDRFGRITKGFETPETAIAENRIRLAQARRVLSGQRSQSSNHKLNKAWLKSKYPEAVEWLRMKRRPLRRLIRNLKGAAAGQFVDTLASSVHFRQQRHLHIGGLLEALAPYPDEALRTFTIININWRVTARQLSKLRPKTIIRQLRTHLERCGVNAIPGPLIAYIHGEFDPVSGLFQLHFHGVTTAEKAKALRGLVWCPDGSRRNWGYVRTPTGSSPIRRVKLRDRFRQLSYLFKSYWLSRRIVIGDDGKPIRDRTAQRIAEPIHSLVLLWFARETVPDLRLLTGVRPLANGRLRLTDAVFDAARVIPKDRRCARSNGPSRA